MRLPAVAFQAEELEGKARCVCLKEETRTDFNAISVRQYAACGFQEVGAGS